MPSPPGQPIKVEDVDLTGNRDDSRSPDVHSGSEHGSVRADESSYHSADEDSADHGLPLGERFPSELAIQAGLNALAAGHEASWGYTPAGVIMRAPVVGLGPETGGSSKCRSVKKCERGD